MIDYFGGINNTLLSSWVKMDVSGWIDLVDNHEIDKIKTGIR